MSESLLDSEMLDSYRELASPDDPDFFKTYLNTFLAALPALVDSILNSIETSNADQLARAAHAIKSSCMNVGAADIVNRCAQMELIGKSGTIAGAGPLSIEVVALIRRLTAEVHALPEFRK
jgi:HPt (histidine-containing phosphotransfer) domain-containing protein